MNRRSATVLPMPGGRTAGCALALLLAATATGAHAEDAATAAPIADAGQDQIIVTARKVKERLGDVPIAITAIAGDQLNQNNHIRLEDLNQLTPSTVVVITNGHQASVSIRGLGNNPGSDGLENSAGIFVDGVYLGRPGMAAMDLIDIQQIEQLRGPQGTLFGKNTTAGALNITTALPSFDFGARGAFTYGNYNYQQYQASVTGPISDTLAFRLTGYRTTRGGTIDNITTGRKTGTLGREGGRLQLLYKPNDDFSIRLIGEYAREQQSTGAVTTVSTSGLTPAKLQALAAATGAKLAIDPDGLKTASDGPVRTGTRQAAGSAEINWKLGGGFTLTSITAYRYWQYDSASDTEGSSADVMYGGYHIHDRQWSQEVRLAFPRMGNIDLITGLYYFNQKVHTDQHSEYGKDAAAWLSGISNALLPVYAQSVPALAGLLLYNNTRWDTIATPLTRSYAAFGQATWHVTPSWNITGGIRETHETKSEEVYRPVPISRITGAPVAGLAGQAGGPLHVSLSDTAPSFLVSTDYHPTRNVMVYALVSRGQKAGGLNTSLVPTVNLTEAAYKVGPETATNYEIGLKGDLFSHKLVLNFDIFRTNVRNYQANVTEVINSQIVSPIVSAGRVRTQGFEAEATLSPARGLSLHGFAAYNDAKYLSYVGGPCPLEAPGTSCNLSGKPVVGAPKWTLGINGTYEHPLGDRLVAYLSPEYSWRSHYYGSADDSVLSVTGGYGLLNLRLGVRTADQRWDLSLWGRNVTDKHYVTNYFNYGTLLPGTYATFFGDPATYGMTLRFNY